MSSRPNPNGPGAREARLVTKFLTEHRPQRRRRRQPATLEKALRALFKTPAMRHIGHLLFYGPVPPRGAAGRAAAKHSKAAKRARRAARIRELHTAGRSNRAIADELRVSRKTVQRALRGCRQRRRTGGTHRGARGRFERNDREGHSQTLASAAKHPAYDPFVSDLSRE